MLSAKTFADIFLNSAQYSECGGCIYCHDTDMDSIRREIAECFECELGDVHLYSYHEKTVCYFESEQDEEEFDMEM